ncbi:MAG TPA: cytochrome c-type biogenesis protein [Vicinamibacteria bacterium]
MKNLTLAAVFSCLGLIASTPSPAQDTPEATPAPAAPAFVVGAPKGPPLTGPALRARTEEVGGLLRCPVCQGLSVADSPATMAVNMKAQVGEMLAQGYDQEQILTYFERSYGEFVRLQPPLRGANWLVWLGPLGALLAGAAVVAWALRKSSPAAPAPEREHGASAIPEPSDLPRRDSLPDDPRLADAVRRVRELAYGWPDGAAPQSPDSRS